MALKQTNNDIGEVFLQNENLQTEKYISAPNYIAKTYKSNSSGIKYGLSELSNDKFYLETELPARKRFKPETEVFNTTKHLNKICKAIGNDDESVNFVNEEKYSGEMSNILSSEQGFENNSKKTGLLKSDLNEDIGKLNESSSLKSGTCNSVYQNNNLSNQCKLDLNELAECKSEKYEKESDHHDFEPKISYQGKNEFDDEINKCYELLNLDVPRMSVVSTATKTTNDNFSINMIENSQIYKCDIDNDKNPSLDTLNPQSNKLVVSLKGMSNDGDINLRTISVGKKLKIQDKLLNKKEETCKDIVEFKDEGNLVPSTMAISNSFSTTCDENCVNMNGKFFHNEINVSIENNSLESEFKYNNNKNNPTSKINNRLNVNSTSIRESNTFIPDAIQNYDCKTNTEHLDLTTKSTLRSDTLKLQETNQDNVSQDHLNDEISSTVSDSGDTLILYDESDIDFDETKEISESDESESAHVLLKEMSNNNVTVSNASLDGSKISTYNSNKVEKKDNCILSERINLLDEKHPLDNKNCEPLVLDGISNNDRIENLNDFDAKVDESFVSEYEISLLLDDTDSIFSDESIDSEYEVSLLEDDINDEGNQNESFDSKCELSLLEEDINDEENQNDLHENECDSNISPKYLPNGDEKEKRITANLQRQAKESKIERENDQTTNNVELSEKDKGEKITKESKTEHENDQTTNNVNLSEKETDKVVFENKMHSKSNFEKNPSNFYKHDKVAGKTGLDVKISDQEKEVQTFSKTESSKNTSDKTEQHSTAIADGKIILKLEQSTTLRSEKANVIDDILIEMETSENNKGSQFQLKLEINDESRIENKLILNSSEVRNSKAKSIIVATNKHHADSSCTDKTTIEKLVKTEMDVFVESKDVNNKFQPSKKVVTMIETRSDENALIVNTNKQLTESTSTDQAIGETTVKTDLSVPVSGELKRNVENIIPDYYEEEKEDLINPGWNKIKALSTDEERYRQVRDCWESKNIPNPFKNLTYYSYRKRNINCGENNTRETRQHKRHASNNLNDNNAKRSRACTYIFDDRIKSIEREKEMNAQNIENKLFDEVTRLNEQCLKEETRLQNFNGYNFDFRRQQFELNGVRREFQHRISSVTAEYEQKVYDCHHQYTSEINSLKNNRNEVFQFYNFYKGLNTNEYKDPTILTQPQMQELEEIENIYIQMDQHYK